MQRKSYSFMTGLDMLSAAIGFFAGVSMRHGFNIPDNVELLYQSVFVVVLFSVVAIAFFFRPYEDIFLRGYWLEMVNVTKCVTVQMICAVAYLFLTQGAKDYSRLAFAYAAGLIWIITYAFRIIAKVMLTGYFRKIGSSSKMLLIANYNQVEPILTGIHTDPTLNYEVTGIAVMDMDMTGKSIAGIPVTASAGSLYDDARLTVVDSVLIGIDPSEDSFKDLVNLFHVMGITIHIYLKNLHLGLPNQQIEKMGELTVLTGNGSRQAVGNIIAKRMLDIIGAVIGLCATGILWLFVAPAIKIESRGPVFFSQIRVGKNGRRFRMYKFRSMYVDAEEHKGELKEDNKMSGMMFKVDNDPRITKVGRWIRKTSIDEFPQFWNVLKGEMSLVGTRPPTEDEFSGYKARYKKRLTMKPGITGLWQVSGRSDITDFEDVVHLDVEYIESWSLGLDLRILFLTLFVILGHKGAQ